MHCQVELPKQIWAAFQNRDKGGLKDNTDLRNTCVSALLFARLEKVEEKILVDSRPLPTHSFSGDEQADTAPPPG